MTEFTTCKLILPPEVTKEQLTLLLKKHTSDFSIANFYPDWEVGSQKMSFAVVDVPQKVVHELYNEAIVRTVDLMTTYYKKPTKAEDCSGGGCGCAPRG